MYIYESWMDKGAVKSRLRGERDNESRVFTKSVTFFLLVVFSFTLYTCYKCHREEPLYIRYRVFFSIVLHYFLLNY